MDMNKLRGKIVEAGMTQRDLADACGCSANTLSRKINGKTPFDTRDIRLICEALSITDNAEKAEIFLS